MNGIRSAENEQSLKEHNLSANFGFALNGLVAILARRTDRASRMIFNYIQGPLSCRLELNAKI